MITRTTTGTVNDQIDARRWQNIQAGARIAMDMVAERDQEIADLRLAVDSVLNILAMAKKKTPKDELLSLIEMARERLQEVEEVGA